MEPSVNMRFVQARLVTDEVERLATFYADMIGTRTTLNAYYVEVPAGHAGVALSKSGFAAYPRTRLAATDLSADRMILDFQVADVDAQYARIDRLGVSWILPPTTQPWGTRAMAFHDPVGNPVNVFSQAPDPHR